MNAQSKGFGNLLTEAENTASMINDRINADSNQQKSSVKIQFLDRTTADLFEYITRNNANSDRSHEWALTSFVTVDGELLTLEQYTKLKQEWKDKLIGSVFSMATSDAVVIDPDTGTVAYDSYVIQRRKIKGSVLTEIQAKFAGTRNNTKSLKDGIVTLFDIDLPTLDRTPYVLGVALMNELKFFLDSNTKFRESNISSIDELFN